MALDDADLSYGQEPVPSATPEEVGTTRWLVTLKNVPGGRRFLSDVGGDVNRRQYEPYVRDVQLSTQKLDVETMSMPAASAVVHLDPSIREMLDPLRDLPAARVRLAAVVGTERDDYARAMLRMKPVAYWRLGELSGTTFEDSSGNGWHASSAGLGGVTSGQDGAIREDPDTAILNDGASTSGIDTDSATVTGLGGAWSLMTWVSPAAIGKSHLLLSGIDPPRFLLWAHNSNRFRVEWRDSANASTRVLAPVGASFETGLWYFVVATHDGTTGRLYVNGRLVGSLVGDTLSYPATRWFISRYSGAGHAVQGRQDESAIVNRALSPAEIRYLYEIGHGMRRRPNIVTLLDDAVVEEVRAATVGRERVRYDEEVLGDKPQNFWPLDDLSGTTATDLMGGANGAYAGTYTLGSDGPLAKEQQNFALDTSSTLGSHMKATSVPALGSTYSFEIWFNADNISTTPVVIGGVRPFAVLQSDGAVRVRFRDAGAAEINLTSPTGLVTTGKWYHLAFTHDGATAKLYLNGREANRSTNTAQSVGVQDWYVGNLIAASNQFDGKSFGAALYAGRALTPRQVLRHYRAGTEGLYRFNREDNDEPITIRAVENFPKDPDFPPRELEEEDFTHAAEASVGETRPLVFGSAFAVPALLVEHKPSTAQSRYMYLDRQLPGSGSPFTGFPPDDYPNEAKQPNSIVGLWYGKNRVLRDAFEDGRINAGWAPGGSVTESGGNIIFGAAAARLQWTGWRYQDDISIAINIKSLAATRAGSGRWEFEWNFETQDDRCVITFDYTGNLISVRQIVGGAIEQEESREFDFAEYWNKATWWSIDIDESGVQIGYREWISTFTVTIFSPAVFTLADGTASLNRRVRLSTTGALPTGLNTTTAYFVVGASNQNLSLTKSGPAINTSGSQSGTHTMRALQNTVISFGKIGGAVGGRISFFSIGGDYRIRAITQPSMLPRPQAGESLVSDLNAGIAVSRDLKNRPFVSESYQEQLSKPLSARFYKAANVDTAGDLVNRLVRRHGGYEQRETDEDEFEIVRRRLTHFRVGGYFDEQRQLFELIRDRLQPQFFFSLWQQGGRLRSCALNPFGQGQQLFEYGDELLDLAEPVSIPQRYSRFRVRFRWFPPTRRYKKRLSLRPGNNPTMKSVESKYGRHDFPRLDLPDVVHSGTAHRILVYLAIIFHFAKEISYVVKTEDVAELRIGRVVLLGDPARGFVRQRAFYLGHKTDDPQYSVAYFRTIERLEF